MSPSLVSEIENGTKEGSIDTLRKLAHALKVDVDTLLP
jgi:transcriptional regulator with XRE-family HTH domain